MPVVVIILAIAVFFTAVLLIVLIVILFLRQKKMKRFRSASFDEYRLHASQLGTETLSDTENSEEKPICFLTLSLGNDEA